MTIKIRPIFFCTTILAAGLVSAPGIFAQTADSAAPAQEQSSPEEIVVTARNRAEKLKDVPISITAITGDTLDNLDVTSTNALANYSPSLTFPTFTPGYFAGRLGNRPLIFRGLNLVNNNGIDAASLVFIDGAPLLGGEIPVGLDVARVEVLRGPQSVYFGRSTMAGAVNYVTKDASDNWSGDFEAKLGTYDKKSFQGSISGPIVPGKLNVGIIGSDVSNGGYDANPGNPGEKLGAQSTNSIAVTIDFRPTDTITIKAFGNYFEEKDGPADEVTLHSTADNCKLSPAAVNNYYCGAFPTYSQIPNAFWQNTQMTALEASTLFSPKWLTPGEFSPQFGAQRKAILGHVVATWEIGDFATLESRTAYEHDESLGASDSVLEPPSLAAAPGDSTYAFSFSDNTANFDQELRLNSAGDGPLHWTVGANFIHATDADGADLVLQPVGLNFFIPVSAPFGQTYSRTYGTYAGFNYDILEDLTLTGEARYQWDERKAVGGTTSIDAIFKSFSPRVALNWKITPDVTAYISYAKGTRPGGFNSSVITPPFNSPAVIAQAVALLGPVNLAYREESLKTYEIGAKGAYFDGKLHLNADFYYGELDNEQVQNFAVIQSIQQTFAVIGNIGQTQIYGVEADGELKATENLTLTGSFSWNHSRIEQYLCTSCYAFTANDYSPVGHNLGNAPVFSGALEVNYRDHLMQTEWDWYGEVDYVYRGAEYISNYANNQIPSRNIVDLRAGIDNHSVLIEAFIENVTNDRNYESGNPQEDFATSTETAFQFAVPPPRIFGGRVKYHFNGFHSEVEPASQAAYTPPPVQAPMKATTARSYMVFFDFNKSDLTSQAVSIVDQAAANAGPAKVTQLVVTGHTDTVGSDAYNMRLSRRRAESVAAELEKKGIPSSEIEIVAKGKKDLLVPTADGVREPQNRRVQIVYEGGATS